MTPYEQPHFWHSFRVVARWYFRLHPDQLARARPDDDAWLVAFVGQAIRMPWENRKTRFARCMTGLAVMMNATARELCRAAVRAEVERAERRVGR